MEPISNYKVFKAIKEALEKLGLAEEVGYDVKVANTSGIATEYKHPSGFEIRVTLDN